jgi:hypothetical protein
MDTDTEGKENQGVLVGKEGAVMMVLFVVLIILLLIAISGICYAVYVHSLIKNSDDWMDNSEYDYGHDVHYEQDDEQL